MSSITITALVLFATTYILMMAFQKIRPYVAVASAVIFVVLGTIAAFKPDLFGADFFSLGSGNSFSYTFKAAVGEIDWNVIMMIAGTMGTVYLFIESKMPQLMSDVLISKMPNVKWAVVCMSLFAGIVSAFVDNVATVLMIAPVALALCKKLNISPVPSIICIAVSSNSRVRRLSSATRLQFCSQRRRISISQTSSLMRASPACSGSLKRAHLSAH